MIDKQIHFIDFIGLNEFIKNAEIDKLIIDKKFLALSLKFFIQKKFVYVLVHTHSIANSKNVLSFSNKDDEFQRKFYKIACKLGYKLPLVFIVVDCRSYLARVFYGNKIIKDNIINYDSDQMKCDKGNLHIITNNSKGVIYYAPTGSVFTTTRSNAKQLIKLQEKYYKKIENKLYGVALREILFKYLAKKETYKIKEYSLYTQTKCITKLEIIIQNGCNLKCKYCYADEGTYGNKFKYMTCDNIQNYLEAFIKQGIVEIDQILFFGGEPTAFPSTIKTACDKIKNMVLENQLSKMPQFYMITNCTLICNELIDVIKEYDIHLTVSIDGPKIIHDMLRVDKNNKGTFDIVCNNIKKLKQKNIIPALAEVTYTSLHEKYGISRRDLEEFIIEEFGINNIYIADCESDTLAPSSDYYDNYIKYTVDEIKKQNTNIKKLNLSQIRFIYSIVENIVNPKNILEDYCVSGYTTIALTPDGKLYPCHRFIYDDKFCVGKYYEGKYNNDMYSDTIKQLSKYKKTKILNCKNCWARLFCMPCTWDLKCQCNTRHVCDETRKAVDIVLREVIADDCYENICSRIINFYNDGYNI